jgi:hypothetical protein
MSEANAAQLAALYIKMRDKRAQLLHDYEAADNAVKDQMKLVQQKLLDICNETGANSLKTVYGTVTRSIKNRYWTSDWSAMREFIKDNDALDLLEQRIHQTNMKTFLAEHPDKLPPGLNQDSEFTISVRKAK